MFLKCFLFFQSLVFTTEVLVNVKHSEDNAKQSN